MLFLSLFFSPRFICVYFKIFEQHRHHSIPSLRSLFLNCQLFREVEKTPKSWYSSSRDNKCLLCEIAFKAHFCTTDFFFFSWLGPTISPESSFQNTTSKQSFLSASTLSCLTDVVWCHRSNNHKLCIKCFPEKSRGVIECDGRIFFFFLMMPHCVGISPNQFLSSVLVIIFFSQTRWWKVE